MGKWLNGKRKYYIMDDEITTASIYQKACRLVVDWPWILSKLVAWTLLGLCQANCYAELGRKFVVGYFF